MKYPHHLLCIISVLVLFSCNGIKTSNKEISDSNLEYPISLDLTDIDNKQSVSLSQIADSVSYIKLESNIRTYLPIINGVQMNNDFIFVNTPGQVRRFAADGSYISEVNKVGRGPGEGFARCYTIDSNENHVFIYSNYTDELMQYNGDNSFVGNLKTSADEIHFVEKLYYYKENLLLGIRSYPNIKYFFQVYNLKNDSIRIGLQNKYVIDDEIDYRRIGFNTKSVFFNSFRDTLLFKETFCDTIFSTTNLETFSPRYILNLGRDKISYSDDLLSRLDPKRQNKTTVVADNFCETSRYIFIRYDLTTSLKRNMKLVIYDKLEKEIYVQDGLEIENDLDSGFNFKAFGLLNGIWSYNDKIYCLLDPIAIKEAEEKIEKDKITRADSFSKLAKDIDINDNPVIMVIDLKKL